MRISDWSSDVCSSDLVAAGDGQVEADGAVGGHRRLVGGLGAGAVAGGERAAGDDVVAAARQDQVAAGDGRVHVGVAGVVDLGRAVGLGDAVVCGAERVARHQVAGLLRSEEHTSELQSLMRISYAVFCLKKK